VQKMCYAWESDGSYHRCPLLSRWPETLVVHLPKNRVLFYLRKRKY
jgi:hypothetical protein